jgi:hypothetical protein
MVIQLTPQQLQALDNQGTGDFDAVREIIEDELRQRSIRGVALRNAVGRMDESS